jgi:hypothetical protein
MPKCPYRMQRGVVGHGLHDNRTPFHCVPEVVTPLLPVMPPVGRTPMGYGVVAGLPFNTTLFPVTKRVTAYVWRGWVGDPRPAQGRCVSRPADAVQRTAVVSLALVVVMA